MADKFWEIGSLDFAEKVGQSISWLVAENERLRTECGLAMSLLTVKQHEKFRERRDALRAASHG